MSQVSSTKKLLSASVLMASGTMISRVLGVVRTILIVFILGNGTRQADIQGIATTVPNALYTLFAGGALNTVLVPQIVRAIKNDEDGGEAYTNRIMTAFMMIVTAVAVVITMAAPLVTSIYSSAEWREPALAEQYASMVALTYLTLPQIFFYGAFFLLGQILNARDKFGPMMWAPIANNVISILVLGIYLLVWGNQQDHSAAFTAPQILLLGVGSTLGIAAQTIILIPIVRKVGFKLRPRFDLKGTGLGHTFSLAKWTFAFVAVNQVVLAVVNRLGTSATAAGAGAGINVYNNAHLLWILPHSLVTVSLATAMLPNASRLAAGGDLAGVGQELTKTARLALIAIVPSTIVFFALSGPVAAVLFGHGSGARDAVFVAWTLMAFAVGLIPFTVQFVCLRTFYALEDTRTPFFIQTVIAGINALMAMVLVWVIDSPNWVAPALGLAYSVAYLLGVGLSWFTLRTRVAGIDGWALLMHIVRLLIGSVVGGALAYLLAAWLDDAVQPLTLANLLSLLIGGPVILLSYLFTGRLLKVRELKNLKALIPGRLRRGGETPKKRDDEFTITQALDEDDGGPVTIVRNRPPVVAHTFDELPERSELATALDDQSPPTQEQSTGEEFWDDLTGPGAEDDGGTMDLSEVFRPEPPEEEPARIGEAGVLLNTRYELVEQLARRYGTETWRAHDQVLSRDVIVHVIAPDDARTDDLMQAARKGAAATDSRFLRVLDADTVLDANQGIGAYVVAEYAAGRSLTDLLAKGPLSALEGAHVVREIADALVGVHAQGLFHEQLTPDNVIITTAGAVRLVGFGVEATLAGQPSGQHAWASKERADVVGLGRLLYAALVRAWPGEERWGLPAAPVSGGDPAPAHTVAVGISPALDRICTATLTSDPAQRTIESASQMARALSELLGTANASLDLEQRVRTWATMPDAPATAALAQPGPPTQVQTPQQTPPVPRVDAAPAPKIKPAPPPFRPHREPERPRRAMWLLVSLGVVVLVVALIVVAINNAIDNGRSAPTAGGTQPSAAAPAAAEVIAAAKDFDPEADGGNDEENTERVANVHDGDTSTSWVTQRYRKRANLGGLKPGVGVVLDLGSVRRLSVVKLTMPEGPTTVELRVPKGQDQSMRTEADWRVVAEGKQPDGTSELKPSEPVQTRYVLVYLTKLPKAGGGYRGEISEIKVG